MNAQRLTTISSRILMGFASAFLVHSSLSEYWMSGFWLHIATVVGAFILVWLSEYNPRDNSRAERAKADRANWMQTQALTVGLVAFLGGLFVWLS